ncbi:MAG TPA: carboxypeptidase regulatory-like domain-containing protein [Candidatus Hydrogenedentes bacterium]|nr:carboxypeptidase regulatory-like domain-containing protein [Candidatus Hydrogenedentota bacterium]HIJ73278.1 carboxypeptidase regulatory-like domain-containing protein [Candidatus Hydrogenedentota bacterium]
MNSRCCRSADKGPRPVRPPAVYKSLLVVGMLTLVSCATIPVTGTEDGRGAKTSIAAPAELATVAGRVTYVRSGKGAPGIPIVINSRLCGVNRPDGTYTVKNAPVGMCGVGARDKDWHLVPHRHGAISAYYNCVQYPRAFLAPGQVTRLDMEVAMGAKISGVVLDAMEQPVADTYIWIVNQLDSNSIVAAKTGALGHYTSFGVAAGVPLEFLVWTNDGRGSARRTLTLEPGVIREVDFVLNPDTDYRIAGTISGPLGRHSPNVPLRCSWREGPNRCVWCAESDENGAYCFSGLDPNHAYEVHAYGQSVGYATKKQTVSFASTRNGVNVGRLDFVLDIPAKDC